MKRQFYLGIAAYILCLSQLSNIDKSQAQVQACQESQTVANGCLKINPDALPIIVEVSDIYSQNTVQKVGQGSLLNPTPLTGSSFTAPNKQITKTITNLWQLEVPSGSENNFTANYQCSNFTHTGQSSPSIDTVSIQSTSITLIGPSSSNSGKVVIQGGATFTFDMTNTKASGNHSCNLQIDVIEK